MHDARMVLAKMKASVGMQLLPDGIGLERLPAYVEKPSQLTDGHLVELATAHGARLATFDQGIPDAEIMA